MLLATLSGCANTFGGAAVHRVSPTIQALSQPATVRSAYTNGTQICSEPPPDAALQAVANAAAKVTTKAGAVGELSGGLTTSIVTLAGRTQVVLIGRDAFTANCMLGMNGKIDPSTSQQNFLAVLDIIKAIAKTDETQAQTEAVRVAALVAPSTDPAVKQALAGLKLLTTTNVDRIMAALSDAKGVFVPARSAAFFAMPPVVELLGSPVAASLAKVSDPADLQSRLMGAYYSLTPRLAELAADFKG